MKRNDDLIRDILLALEAQPAGELLDSNDLNFDGHSSSEIHEHCTLLEEAGFITVFAHVRGGYTLERLTMAGHDYLANIREPTRWGRIKSAAAAAGGAGFETFAFIAKRLATQEMGDALDKLQG